MRTTRRVHEKERNKKQGAVVTAIPGSLLLPSRSPFRDLFLFFHQPHSPTHLISSPCLASSSSEETSRCALAVQTSLSSSSCDAVSLLWTRHPRAARSTISNARHSILIPIIPQLNGSQSTLKTIVEGLNQGNLDSNVGKDSDLLFLSPMPLLSAF